MRKILSGRRGLSNQQSFRFTVDTSITDGQSEAAGTFRVPIDSGTPTGGGAMAFIIDWGDGTTSNVNSSNFATTTVHTYNPADASYPDYTINCTGEVRGWSFQAMSSGQDDAVKLISILQWGSFIHTQNFGAFINCTELVLIDALDSPTFENTSLYRLFYNCTALKRILKIANWDVSSITSMNQTFYKCNAFNESAGGQQPDLTSWDVSSVTTMLAMFAGCGDFNGRMFTLTATTTTIRSMFDMTVSAASLPGIFNNGGSNSMFSWVTDGLVGTALQETFAGSAAFNQPIRSWNVSGVTSMFKMFWGDGNAMAFNQLLNGWNVANVTNMCGMFGYCNSYQQRMEDWNVNSWTTLSSVSVTGLTDSTQTPAGWDMSTSYYDDLLVEWDTLYSFPALSVAGTVNFGNTQYTGTDTAVTAARTSLISKWGMGTATGIIDGGPV